MNAIRAFLKLETASGLVLMLATLGAVILANTSLLTLYHSVLTMPVGPWPLIFWINDGLMALFFFVVGMEIKLELVDGALNTFDRAILPVLAAIGGMTAPALIFCLIAGSGPDARGWGIPMATDIAFALGVLVILGKRVPPPIKVFLLALAIADDLGAVLVVALFYTRVINLSYLSLAFATAFLIWFLLKKRIRSALVLVPLGILLWFLAHRSGVHATIAGCVLGFLAPNETLRKWLHLLHPITSFLIMPIFALANAGISFAGFTWEVLVSNNLVNAVSFALLLGKPVGIFGVSYIAIRAGLAKLPEGVRLNHLFAAGALGGIGFTMALFVSNLALLNPASLELAKVGVVKGSLLSAALGICAFLFTARSSRPRDPGRGR